MNILAIDTSARHLSVAVGDESGKIRIARTVAFRRDLSEQIARRIEETLKKAKLTLRKVDVIAIGLGPGSFTGLRIGLSAAKALSFSLQIPLIGVSSLDALALAAPRQRSKVCALVDARRGLFYAAVYENDGGAASMAPLRRLTDHLLIPLEEALKNLSGPVYFIGDGISLAQETIKERQGKKFAPVFAPARQWTAQAKFLLEAALPRIRQKDFDVSEKLTPIYLYPEDCQVQNRM